MSTQSDVIKKFMESLDTTNLKGATALDAAVKACSDSKFATAQAAIDQMVADCKKASSADDFLRNYCGIILGNSDTGAITGSDVGTSSVAKTAESIVPESGSLKSFNQNSFTSNDVTFQLVGEDWEPISVSSLNSNEKFIWQSLYTWWGKNSLDLISSSYGSNFGFGDYSSATAKTINFGFFSEASGTGAYTSWGSYDNFETISALGMFVNEYNYSDLVYSGNTNGKAQTGYFVDYYLDRTLAHEFTHAVMAANVNNFSYLPQFFKEGIAEFTHGADDVRTANIQALAADASRLSSALNVNDSGTGTVDCYTGGYMFLHYLAKQAVDADKGLYTINKTSNRTINGTANNDTIYSSGQNVEIDVAKGDDYVYLYTGAKTNTVSGGAGNDSIYSSGQKVKIYGDSGNDYVYLFSGTKNATVKGGTGKDTIHVGGKKIKAYGDTGNDYIRSYTNDVNSTLKGGTGNDTFQGGGNKVKMYGESGNDYVYLYINDKNITVSGGAGNDSIYSGANKTSLSGGSGKDYIHLYSEATNTTVNGGTGNDTIKSYSENGTTYVYKSGDGKDVIDGFNFGTDKIKLTSGSVSKTTYSGNDVIFKIGSGSIRVKDGRGQQITINNTTKTYGKATNSSAVVSYSAADKFGTRNTAANSAQLNGSAANTWFAENDAGLSNDSSSLSNVMNSSYNKQGSDCTFDSSKITALDKNNLTFAYAVTKNNV